MFNRLSGDTGTAGLGTTLGEPRSSNLAWLQCFASSRSWFVCFFPRQWYRLWPCERVAGLGGAGGWSIGSSPLYCGATQPGFKRTAHCPESAGSTHMCSFPCTTYMFLGESEKESRSVVSDSLRPRGLYSPWASPGQNTGVGSLSLLQQIFPTQGSNPGLLFCRQILYQLSHSGSPL